MRTRLIVSVVVLGAAAVTVAGVAAYMRYSRGIWDDLARAEAQMGTPASLGKAASFRDGTTFCVISCDEARRVVVFLTDLTAEDACTAALHLAQVVSDDANITMSSGRCFVNGALRGMGKANIAVVVWEAAEIASYPDFRPGRVREVAERALGSRLLEVYLNSGID